MCVCVCVCIVMTEGMLEGGLNGSSSMSLCSPPKWVDFRFSSTLEATCHGELLSAEPPEVLRGKYLVLFLSSVGGTGIS